jgi:hypothetical protein
MPDPAESLFNGLVSWRSLQDLIDAGETEGLYLECKAPASPALNPGMRQHLAEATSGFSNTSGGVLIWGLSTTKHAHSGLDVLTQIEPIGNVASLAANIDRAIPTVAYPTVRSVPSRILRRQKTDTRGAVVTYIPASPGDPVQSVLDRKFYLRTIDGFVEMPYDVLKRMFAGSSGPDIQLLLPSRLVTQTANVWTVPIVLSNKSTAAATFTRITVEILNPTACESISASGLADISPLNPGKTLFNGEYDRPILRGIDQSLGSLSITMKRQQRVRRLLVLKITVLATNMRGRQWELRIHLGANGFTVRQAKDQFIY